MIKLETITIALPSACGEGATLQVDLARFAPHILESLIAHGVKQKVADSCSGAEKKKADDWTVADFNEACAKVVEALYAGTWATKGGGARITTEAAYFASEANKAAKLRITADEKAKEAPAYFKLDAAGRLAHVAKAYAASQQMQAKWAAEWAAKVAAKGTTIDLGDLDI